MSRPRTRGRRYNECPVCSHWLGHDPATATECATCRWRIFRGVAVAFKRRHSGRLRWLLVRNPENEAQQTREFLAELGRGWHAYGTSKTGYMLYRDGSAALV